MTARAEPAPLSAKDSHGLQLWSDNRCIADSNDLGWRSVYADLTAEVTYEDELPGVSDYSLAYFVRGSAEYEGRIGDLVKSGGFQPRQFSLVPANTPMKWKIDGKWDALHLILSRLTIDRIIGDDFGSDISSLQLLPGIGTVDPLLEQLTLSIMRAMLERLPGHALYVDCLAQAMAAQRLQHHSNLKRSHRMPRLDGVTDRRLRWLADYIEAHLDQELTIGRLADEVGLSPLYLAKAFRRAFGEAPHRYLLLRRIERAKELLRSTDQQLAETAIACGFADQSHFSHAFKRLVGVTPATYRNECPK